MRVIIFADIDDDIQIDVGFWIFSTQPHSPQPLTLKNSYVEPQSPIGGRRKKSHGGFATGKFSCSIG